MPARQKHRRAYGSIADLGKDLEGKTRWRIRYTRDGKRLTEVVHGTKRQAEHRLAELHVQVGTERQNLMTLSQAADEWFWPRIGNRAKSTQAAYRRSWDADIAPVLGGMPVTAIRPLDIQAWLDTLTGGTAKTARAVVSQIMEQCAVFGVIQSNPMALKYTMPDKGERDKGVYGLEGLFDVWRATMGSIIEAPVLLMAFGGLRVGEALAVKSECVSSESPYGTEVAVVDVVRQMTCRGLADELKNQQSRRTAVVPGPMGSRLLFLAAASADGWLSGDGVGGPLPQYVLNKEWRRIIDASGIERHPVRNLRNSWETVQHWTLKMDPTIIEPLMGHAGKSVTARHYDRPLRDMVVDAVARAYADNPYADSYVRQGHLGTCD